MFDLTCADSLRNCEKWLKEIDQNGEDDTMLVLVGNKSDLADEREVSQKDAIAFA